MWEMAAEFGMKETPPDHPIYKEPPSIRFTGQSPKSSTTIGASSEKPTRSVDLHSQGLAILEKEHQRQMDIGIGF